MSLPLIAIVGTPNVGKSTLFNRLVGRRKALVHSAPGMTRDINEEICDWRGRQVVLADTGGLLASGDSLLAAAIRERVLLSAAQADVLLLVVDGRLGLTPLDEELGRLFRSTGRPVVVAVNKLDQPGREEAAAEFHGLGFDPVVPISAEHGLGIDALLDAVAERLAAGAPPEAGQPAEEIRLAIAGRPNVGKSSLLNALLGSERALVSETPGTTRDAIDCLLRHGDRTVRIIDTAGIRRKGRVIEKPEVLSVMSAQRTVQRADVVIIVMDCTDGPTQQDLHVAGVAHEARRPFIVLLNKWDLSRQASDAETVQAVRERLRFAPWAPVMTISARTGLRIGRILPLVEEVHAQARRRFTTGRLNAWLQRAVEAHRPPLTRGRESRFYYVAQTGSNPPSFVLFGNSASRPHFSYQRYLENSLREEFGLTRTPVALEYRERPRRERASGRRPGKAPKRPV